MELDWIRTFIVAAEESHFQRAADRLHIVQPTVSLHIHKLEEAWGLSLFRRSGRNVQLSAAGKRALEHAKRIYGAYETSREDMARWRKSFQETLIVAASPIVAQTFLPFWIRQMNLRRPDVQVTLQVADSDVVPRLLERGEADIGFSRSESLSRRLHCEVLYEDPIAMVAPADGFDHDGPPLTMADAIDQYPIITHNHPAFWDDFVSLLRERYPMLRTMQVSLTSVSLQFVEEGFAASFLPRSMIRQSVAMGRVFEVDTGCLPLPMTSTYVMAAVDRQDGACLEFRELVQLYVQERWPSKINSSPSI